MNKWTEDQLSFYDSYIEMLNENLEITECMENIETNVKGFLVVDKLAGVTEETVEAALGEEGKNTVDSDMVLTLTLCKLANEFFGERLDAYIDYLQANPEAGNIGAEVFVNRLLKRLSFCLLKPCVRFLSDSMQAMSFSYIKIL